MLDLIKSHPVNLIRGISVIIEDKATKLRQTSIAIFARHARQWANETREVVQEIATDASALEDEIRAAAADGVITADELARLTSRTREIREEAVTGKIITA
jgi:hypothetical protein